MEQPVISLCSLLSWFSYASLLLIMFLWVTSILDMFLWAYVASRGLDGAGFRCSMHRSTLIIACQ